MGRVGGREHLLAGRYGGVGLAAMHDRRRQQANPTVAVLVVIPAYKLAHPLSGLVQAPKASREIWSILRRFELRLGIGIVIRHVRAAVGLGHAQIGQQLGHGLGCHRAAVVGVQRQLIGLNAFLLACFGNELLRQLPRGYPPTRAP